MAVTRKTKAEAEAEFADNVEKRAAELASEILEEEQDVPEDVALTTLLSSLGAGDGEVIVKVYAIDKKIGRDAFLFDESAEEFNQSGMQEIQRIYGPGE